MFCLSKAAEEGIFHLKMKTKRDQRDQRDHVINRQDRKAVPSTSVQEAKQRTNKWRELRRNQVEKSTKPPERQVRKDVEKEGRKEENRKRERRKEKSRQKRRIEKRRKVVIVYVQGEASRSSRIRTEKGEHTTKER